MEERIVFNFARFRVPAKSRDAFAEIFRKASAAAAKEPGVKGYAGGFDLNDPGLFLCAATYESEDAFTKHQQNKTCVSCAADLGKLMGKNGVELVGAATFGSFTRNLLGFVNDAKKRA